MATIKQIAELAGVSRGTVDRVLNNRGSVNANYDNPFDSIYPWSGMKLCNISISDYMALQPGDSLTDCVTAWDGDPDFNWNDPNGIWRYTPAFYGRSYMSEGYRSPTAMRDTTSIRRASREGGRAERLP